MKNALTPGHKLNIADAFTLARIAGTLALVFLRPLSAAFLWIYALTGLTDVLDGFIARRTHTASGFGARLDSAADLLFYAAMLFRLFPLLRDTLPTDILYAAAAVLLLRAAAYITAAVKYRLFASLHTFLNKLTGTAVFLIPFLLATAYAAEYCRTVCVLAAAASLEELLIHLFRRDYRADVKSFFQKTHPRADITQK